jgi:hypothetical protein
LGRGAVAPPSSHGYDKDALTWTSRFGPRVLAVILLTLGVSHAEAAPQVPTRLIWEGEACGRADDFAARVMQRTHAVRFVSGGERIAVRLAIEPRPEGGLDASVKIVTRGRPAVTRRIQSPDCNDALDALAIVVAISVEGRGSSGAESPAPAAARRAPPRRTPARARAPAPVPSPPEGAEPVAPSGAAATTGGAVTEPEPAPTASGASAPEPVTPTPPVEAAAVVAPEQKSTAPTASAAPPATASPPVAESAFADEPPAVVEETSQEHLTLGGGLAAQVSYGIGPEALLGGAVWLSAGWGRPGLWSPELTLSWTYQRLGGFEDPLGAADFALNAAGLALCPIRIGNGTLEVRPCGTAASGRLVSEGHETYEPQTSNRPWGSLGGTIELIAKVGIVQLRAAIGASAPLVRDGFRFGVDCDGTACAADVFHRVEPVIWSGALGAGVGIW